MTKERMGEIALFILKASLAEDPLDTKQDDEDFEEVARCINISKE